MRSLTFLIVDDNDLQRRVAEQSLWKAGHQVMFAASAEEVENALVDHDAGVVLLSAALPPGEAQAALALAQKPRRDPDTYAVLPPPAMVIGAGEAQRTTAEQLVARGAAGIIPRPYDAEMLATQLELHSVGAFPAHILTIDDSKVARKMVVSILEEEGHDLIDAPDGREGLAMLRDHPEIDMVISDIVMPHVDGFGVCQAIRAQEGGDRMPIILLTSLDDIASQSRAIEAGADEFLTKPISATELKMRVRTILRLKTLQRKLARRNEDLRRALELRESLGRMLVHDFRNPLTRILVATELVGQQCREAGMSDAAEMADEILEGSTRLSELTDDVLQVARLEDGAARPEMIELRIGELIDAVSGDMQRLARQRRVSVTTDAPEDLRVHADSGWIYRVLQNLIENSLKYSPRNGEITISAFAESTDPRAEQLVCVRIMDAGPGIPEDYRQRIFEQFAQVPRQERRGTGLGLAFCRLAVEAHGGTIRATARPDGASGSAFTFTLVKAC